MRRDIGGSFYDVTALSPTDVWTVGTYDRLTSLVDEKPLIEHWDGSRWSMVPSPGRGYRSDFSSLAAVSANDVWAVGSFDEYVAPGQSARRTLAEHWDGRGWSVIPTALPRVGNASSVRRAVAAAGPGDVWAVGADPLVAHWDGTRWTNVAVRYWDGPTNPALLNATTATGSGEFWAVGTRHYNTYFQDQARPHIARMCPIHVSDAGFEPPSSTVAQGKRRRLEHADHEDR